MGRMYTVTMDAAAVTAAKDLMRISAPSDAVVILHEVKVTQDESESSEQLPIQIHRASTDGTGTAATARPLQEGDAAFGGAAVVNLTADATAGDIVWRESQNVLNGWHWLPTPEGRPVISPSGRMVIRLDAAPGASTKFTAVALVEEIGG